MRAGRSASPASNVAPSDFVAMVPVTPSREGRALTSARLWRPRPKPERDDDGARRRAAQLQRPQPVPEKLARDDMVHARALLGESSDAAARVRLHTKRLGAARRRRGPQTLMALELARDSLEEHAVVRCRVRGLDLDRSRYGSGTGARRGEYEGGGGKRGNRNRQDAHDARTLATPPGCGPGSQRRLPTALESRTVTVGATPARDGGLAPRAASRTGR